MDEGAYEIGDEKLIVGHIEMARMMNRIFCFSFTFDRMTNHQIALAPDVWAPDHPAWGGNPQGFWMVAIRRIGMEYFDLFRNREGGEELPQSYVAEKLHLSKSDAEGIALLLNNIAKEYYKMIDERRKESMHPVRKDEGRKDGPNLS